MIVQPDFLDHWKTQLLINLLDDPLAPIYVIRLWAHCHNRKTHGFQRVSSGLTKAICRAPQDAETFENAMVEAGFIEIIDGMIYAHDWDDVNASLIANWTNGKKGGRPKKNNPPITQPKPTVNPSITDKRREEKIDKIEKIERVQYSSAHAEIVNEIIGCRMEFAKLNPESIATEIHKAKLNPDWEKSAAEFIADAANLLEPPRNPIAMLRAYLNRDRKPTDKTERRVSEL